MNAPLAVEALDLERTYASGRTTVAALAGVTLGIRRGEFVAVMGPSGSGKSTLLNVVAGLERPTGGTVRVDGEDLAKLDEVALARHRSKRVGMVFQAFNLLPRFSVVDNVLLRPFPYKNIDRYTTMFIWNADRSDGRGYLHFRSSSNIVKNKIRFFEHCLIFNYL